MYTPCSFPPHGVHLRAENKRINSNGVVSDGHVPSSLRSASRGNIPRALRLDSSCLWGVPRQDGWTALVSIRLSNSRNRWTIRAVSWAPENPRPCPLTWNLRKEMVIPKRDWIMRSFAYRIERNKQILRNWEIIRGSNHTAIMLSVLFKPLNSSWISQRFREQEEKRGLWKCIIGI